MPTIETERKSMRAFPKTKRCETLERRTSFTASRPSGMPVAVCRMLTVEKKTWKLTIPIAMGLLHALCNSGVKYSQFGDFLSL